MPHEQQFRLKEGKFVRTVATSLKVGSEKVGAPFERNRQSCSKFLKVVPTRAYVARVVLDGGLFEGTLEIGACYQATSRDFFSSSQKYYKT